MPYDRLPTTSRYNVSGGKGIGVWKRGETTSDRYLYKCNRSWPAFKLTNSSFVVAYSLSSISGLTLNWPDPGTHKYHSLGPFIMNVHTKRAPLQVLFCKWPSFRIFFGSICSVAVSLSIYRQNQIHFLISKLILRCSWRYLAGLGYFFHW